MPRINFHPVITVASSPTTRGEDALLSFNLSDCIFAIFCPVGTLTYLWTINNLTLVQAASRTHQQSNYLIEYTSSNYNSIDQLMADFSPLYWLSTDCFSRDWQRLQYSDVDNLFDKSEHIHNPNLCSSVKYNHVTVWGGFHPNTKTLHMWRQLFLT